MKIPSLLLLMPITVAAQMPEGMDMAKMQEMAACMQNIDQEALAKLEPRMSQFQKEVKSLCTNGQRNKAQAKAKNLVEEFEPYLQQIATCTKDAPEMMSGILKMNQKENHHICDDTTFK